jgi:gluconate 2-dehydrogenase gamma chain
MKSPSFLRKQESLSFPRKACPGLDPGREPSDVTTAMRDATLDALVERIYPETDWGPGASRLEVAKFIRRMADSSTGRGEDYYQAEPFHPSDDRSRGWQWRETPQQLLDTGLDRLDTWAREYHSNEATEGTSFARLSVALQEQAIAELEAGSFAEFPLGAARAFFDLVHSGVFDALFVAPALGSYSLDSVWTRLDPESAPNQAA